MIETRSPPGGVDDALFNPTHVDRVEAAGRELVLVTLSGAIGIQQDDPGTPAIELGALPLSPAGVQVLDPETLEIVGSTGPVADAAFGFGGIAVHPSGRVGVVGSAAHRSVYVIDLQPLAALTTPGRRAGRAAAGVRARRAGAARWSLAGGLPRLDGGRGVLRRR